MGLMKVASKIILKQTKHIVSTTIFINK